MACCPTEKSYGYESCRFEKDVDEHLHCSICYNVLKEPRTCINNEHIFCLACIIEHLSVNSQSCPECNEHLSEDTLRRPRVVNNILSKLKIKCDYASRGCPEFVCVEELQSHVENCGFAPVLCSNEECSMEINKQDKVHHEIEVCKYRKVKCRDCGQAQKVVERLEGNLMEWDKRMNNSHGELKRIVEKMEGSLEGINKKMNEKVDAMKRQQQEVKKNVDEVKNEVKDVKENLSKVNTDVDEVKVMMSQMLEKLNMLELLNKLPSPSEGMMNTPREDILIAGGTCFNGKSVEIYSWEKNGWFEVSEMNEEHQGASSFIFKDQLFVVGGEKGKTIETLDLSELPLKWMKFPGVELPYKCGGHQTVVYQDRIIHIGGENYDEGKVSKVISELQLTSPCTMKELCKMPGPRQGHGAEIFEDKVLIIGGEHDGDISSSVFEFDVENKKCKEMPPVPHTVAGMATARWKDQVVALGGLNEEEEFLNDVFMYDCKTGKITALPSMLEKRCFCCAVISGDTIVVMGGGNKRDITLSSVECFTMGSSTWEYLPALNLGRCMATAVVLPSTRKYV